MRGYESKFYDTDVKNVDKALHLLEEFNSQNIVGQEIRLNIPEVWTFEEASVRDYKIPALSTVDQFISAALEHVINTQ